MLSQNLSVNTNIDAMVSSSFNIPHQNNTVNVSMIVGGGAAVGHQNCLVGTGATSGSKPGSNTHFTGSNVNKKIKS